MKSILVIGLVSSCTRYVSKLLARNLIGITSWNGQQEILNDEYKIVHFSLPEDNLENFGNMKYFQSFDVIVICIRDFYCSLISKNKIHQSDFKKAFDGHIHGQQVLQSIYEQLKPKVILYSYETAFVLGEKYNFDFLSRFNLKEFSNITIEDVNSKYILNTKEESFAKKIIRLCNETPCNCIPWKVSNKPIHLPPINELKVITSDPQSFMSIGVKFNNINNGVSHLIVCDNIESLDNQKLMDCSKICCKSKINNRIKEINLFRNQGYDLINEEIFEDDIILIFRAPRKFEKEIWNGQKGTVLIHSNGGFGDDIYSLRFSSLFDKNETIFESRIEIKSFIEATGKYNNVIAKGEIIPDHDYQISNKQLDEKFRSICKFQYLTINNKIKFKTSKFKIGLAFQGNKIKYGEKREYDPNEMIKPFKKLEKEIQFYCLQKKENLSKSIIDVSSFIHDWSDAATYVKSMDCIITPDTALAHLSVTLGIPTFVALNTSHVNFWINHPNKTSHLYPQKIQAFWGNSAFEEIKKTIEQCYLSKNLFL